MQGPMAGYSIQGSAGAEPVWVQRGSSLQPSDPYPETPLEPHKPSIQFEEEERGKGRWEEEEEEEESLSGAQSYIRH